MQYRKLGRTEWNISTIGFGGWAIGGKWGPVDDRESYSALKRAVELGVNFFDTADVYGDGHSERLLGKLRREVEKDLIIATKAGRRLDAPEYNRKNLIMFVERSLNNLGTDIIDLLQLHCPPPDVYYMPEVFGLLDDLVGSGKIRYYGVSVNRVEEALKAIEYPHVQSVQIIFNLFRQRPAELFLDQAKKKNVSILARVPLASGLLTGKFNPDSRFAPDDHRLCRREWPLPDRGETFAGVDYEMGLRAVEEFKSICPQEMSMAQFALRWILMFDGVTSAIPGAKYPFQVEENISASDLPPLSEKTMVLVRKLYESRIREYVHQYW